MSNSNTTYTVESLTKMELLKLAQNRRPTQRDILTAKQDASWDRYQSLFSAYSVAHKTAMAILDKQGTGRDYYNAAAKADDLYQQSERASKQYDRLLKQKVHHHA